MRAYEARQPQQYMNMASVDYEHTTSTPSFHTDGRVQATEIPQGAPRPRAAPRPAGGGGFRATLPDRFFGWRILKLPRDKAIQQGISLLLIRCLQAAHLLGLHV
jgi:hypothetical protein